jgi:hypothetical protein
MMQNVTASFESQAMNNFRFFIVPILIAQKGRSGLHPYYFSGAAGCGGSFRAVRLLAHHGVSHH